MTARPELAPAIEEVIRQVLAAAALSGQAREEVERDLREHFEDGLLEGTDPEELVRRFGNPTEAGQRISAARRRRSPRRPGGPDLDWLTPTDSGFRWRHVWSDLRQAARTLSRSPGYAALVIVTLALGMGANTAVFSVLDAVLLRPLPYDEPHELVRIDESWDASMATQEFSRAPVVNQIREWTDVFEAVGTIYTYRETGADLTGGDRPERVVASRASAGFFEMLGASPLLGRTFDDDESFGPGEYSSGPPNRVAVLSHQLWSRRFGRDRSVVGRTIELDGYSVEVVGVMPAGFQNPFGSPADLWVPQDLRMGGSNGWGNYYLSTIARLKDGITLEAAQARADVLVAGVRETIPDSGDWGMVLKPLQAEIVGTTRRTMLWILAAAVALVLLSACVNVGNLVFARSLDREREVALRGALGSGRGRQMSRLLTENFLLAAGGSLVGLLLGILGVRALLAMAPDALPTSAEPALSPGVFGFALVAMALSLMIFGLAPAFRLSRVPPADVLRAGGRSGTETGGLRRLRSTLVITQVAVALVLLVGAGLLVRSFTALQAVPLGVDPENVLTFEVHLPGSRYPDGADRERFHRQFQESILALSGVSTVGSTSWLPLSGRYNIWGSPLRMDDDVPEEVPSATRAADVRVIGGDYFRTMGIGIVQGVAPEEVDPEGGDVVWISRTVAEQLFPDREPLGAMIWAVNAERRIVGVVEDVAWEARGTTSPTVYALHAQYADNRNWPMIQVVRTRGDLGDLRATIERELAGIDGGLVLFRPRPFQGFADLARAQDRFALFLMTVFAFLALTLAAVGTYGILAGSVAKRTREIGIRMALGADARLVRWGVLRSALAMIAGGVVLGGFLAWGGSRWLSSLLFEVRPGDPIAYIAAIVVLVGIGVAASLLPAHRATRIDPARSLAAE